MAEEDFKSLFDSIKNMELRLKYIEEYVKKLWELRENVILVSVNQQPIEKNLIKGRKMNRPKKRKIIEKPIDNITKA